MTAEWITDEVAARRDDLVDTRRWLHARPELGFEEHEATALIVSRLRRLGLDEEACPTHTGAVASLTGGRPGRTVLVRADIDALPVAEEVDLPFASTTSGTMHACGHDAHTAILLGVAEVLAARAEDLPGRYVFLFQPAEEGGRGAQRMIDGGVLNGLGASASVGCHVSPAIPTGLVGLRDGVAMAAVHDIHVHLRGAGGHGAMSGRHGNVVLAVSFLAGLLPGTIDGMSYEGMGCACSAGVVRAGTAPNVVPQTAELRGTLRTFTSDQARQGVEAVRVACERTAAEFDVEVDLAIPLLAPAVVNDPGAAARVREAVGGALGAPQVFEMPPAPASDDMSEFLRRLPGCYFFVGAGDEANPSGAHHSPTFRLDEGCLTVGAISMAASAVALAADE